MVRNPNSEVGALEMKEDPDCEPSARSQGKTGFRGSKSGRS